MSQAQVRDKIKQFLNEGPYAVVGASDNQHKYGHKCFRSYLSNNMKAYPVNPRAQEVLGHQCFPDLSSLPETVSSISVVTPPAMTESVVEEAVKLGVKNIWMQPGAESQVAVQRAESAGINVIYGGPCFMVEMGWG
jgi:uncharacterized protein